MNTYHFYDADAESQTQSTDNGVIQIIKRNK